ncbi:hypothetical protein FF100_22170 [Methylobacterium terricola]|uniref:Uncharacterized protein n=1 Tax=Methylobacterium terricola TaxID=2583531 RepID=A0A5C4LCW0_9HYPH|nr:hypothetical protein [Methylobacterium terricola]TNC10860.1 hypothetical protein FF100_22170 [Methylobacterium terricola]
MTELTDSEASELHAKWLDQFQNGDAHVLPCSPLEIVLIHGQEHRSNRAPLGTTRAWCEANNISIDPHPYFVDMFRAFAETEDAKYLFKTRWP